MEVGVRELRAHLSRYLKRVAAGEEFVVTERGRPVARLAPANGRSKLDELIAAGLVEPARSRTGWVPPKRIKAKGLVSDLVKEQRR
jgi:prevent-host-death family protein